MITDTDHNTAVVLEEVKNLTANGTIRVLSSVTTLLMSAQPSFRTPVKKLERAWQCIIDGYKWWFVCSNTTWSFPGVSRYFWHCLDGHINRAGWHSYSSATVVYNEHHG